MGLATLSVGQRFVQDGEYYRLTRIFDAARYEVEHHATGRRSERTQSEILTQFAAGTLVFVDPVEASPQERAKQRVHNTTLLMECTPTERESALLRLHFVKRLEGIPTTRNRLAPLVAAVWNRLKPEDRAHMGTQPHASTVARWMRKWRDSSYNIHALLDQHARKGNREPRIDDCIAEIVDDAIRDIYLRPERVSLKAVRVHVNDLIVTRNKGLIASERVAPVSASFIRHRLELVPAYDRWAARYGKRAADVKFRIAGKGVAADRPLARASMDHCRLDLFVVDTRTRLPLGRPWLTVILDECTRMVLGYSISFDEPSAMSVMRALRHALMPKATSGSTQHVWPTWGLMDVLVVDNGMEFHGASLEFAAGQFGITIQTCPRRKPWYKGKVERFFRTIQSDLIGIIPGKTFSNIIDRAEYDSAKHAVISLDTLLQIVEIWVVDIYHQTSHSALSESPVQRWDRLAENLDRYIPMSSQWTDAAFGKPDTRVLGHEGIEFDRLHYNSDDLGTLRRLHGDRFTVGIIANDEDVSYLYVVDPEGGDPIRVPAVDQAYAAGMSRWQHRKCKEYAQHLSETTGREVGLAAARAAIAELIALDFIVNPKRGRKTAGRFLAKPKTSNPPGAVVQPTVALPTIAPANPPKRTSTGRRVQRVIPLSVSAVDDDPIPALISRTAHHYRQEVAP